MQRTVIIKIENKDLRETADQYFKAYRFCIDKGMELRTANKKNVHDATCRELRRVYPKLPSALLQTVRDVACENLKAVKLKFSFKNGKASVSTPSARRRLKKLSGKEKRFVRDVNHCVSKQIVNRDYNCFVLEDLKKLPRNRGKSFNRKLGNWSYFQLGNFVNYKAEELGKTTIKVGPKHTSRMCSRCKIGRASCRERV